MLQNPIKLMCFHFAGGAASSFMRWKTPLAPEFQLLAYELPGRGRRFSDPFFETFDEAADDLYNRIKPELYTGSYALFGHSMGSILAYEVCRRIVNNRDPHPRHVFFSANRPPHLQHMRDKISHLSDEAFMQEIDKLGGTPKEVLDHPELLELFRPILRSDIHILENYNSLPAPPLPFPVTAIHGEGDRFDEAVMRRWSEVCGGPFAFQTFPGGHFYINSEFEALVRLLKERVRKANS